MRCLGNTTDSQSFLGDWRKVRYSSAASVYAGISKSWNEGKVEAFNTWKQIGVSVHSREEAVYAERRGADYLIAGHIFLTDCKKGVPARGLDFLKEICASVEIPVFAIGGMNLEHGRMAMEAGASGVCMMSELMESDEPGEIIKRFSGRSE